GPLVTGVQTCALPISISQATWIAASEAYMAIDQLSVFEQVRVPTLFIAQVPREAERQHVVRLAAAVDDASLVLTDGRGPMDDDRSEERRVGKEVVEGE